VVFCEQVAGGIDFKGKAGESRTQAIVEISTQAPPFLLPGGDQALTRALEISGETHRMDSDPSLLSNSVEQSPISSGEGVPWSTWGKQQLPNGLGLVGERKGE
jgi:hypothetical protein